MTVTDLGVNAATDAQAVITYNGVYVKQASQVNGFNWWKHSTASGDKGSSIYWSDVASRWVIEASDVSWEAPSTATAFNVKDDNRHFPGLQDYFGGAPSTWQQLSSITNRNGEVSVTFACQDTVGSPLESGKSIAAI